jgi:two-component system, response regulator PdtaR
VGLPSQGAARPIVLVAEDDDDLRFALSELLESAGYDVVVAPDAEQALRLSGELADGISVALVDLHLPGLSGPALIEALRPANPRMRPVLMTGDHDAVLPAKALVLRKPFRSEALLRALAELVSAR